VADEQNGKSDGATDGAPFRESGSGDSYNPQGNWGAERRRDNPAGGIVPGPEGAPSGAGDGGFGPEGDYTDPARDSGDKKTNGR